MRPWVIRYIVPDSIPLMGGQDLSIPAYFFFLTFGFMLATNILIREGSRAKEDVRNILDLAMLILVGGLVGARLGHIIFEMPGLYIEHPEYIFQIWRGGLVYYGGLIFCIVIGVIFCRWKGLNFWRFADIFAIATAFGLIFGRMGCLSAGCCYGKPADWPLGWTVPWDIRFYSGQVPQELRGIGLHPTQIYEAVACLILYLVLMRLRLKQRFDGQVLWSFLAVYALVRTLIETMRFDLDRGVYLNGLLSTSQVISGLLFLLALIMLPVLAEKAKKNGSYGFGPAWPSLRRSVDPVPSAAN